MIQNKPNITAPATPTKLPVATAELLRGRQKIILCTWQTLDQGGVRLSTSKGLSEAISGYYTDREHDYVGPQIRTKAH